MNTIREAIDEYVDLRRNLGFKLHRAKRTLLKFATFLEDHGADYITQELALAWAKQPKTAQPSKWAERLTHVRGFARHRRGSDPRTEIPSPGLLPYKPKRAKPYIYSDEEIWALLEAAREIPYHCQRQALLPLTYYCLIGLLSVSGLRIGEACNLELKDLDLEAGLLIVRAGKHGRTRLVPLHESTCKILDGYVGRRQQHWMGQSVSKKLFLSSVGNALNLGCVQRTFRKLCDRVGIRAPAGGRAPRLHDFRHTLAVRTLQNWYRQDADPDKMLPVLSTFLGHVRVSDTYWYLENSPGLMKQAMRRLERRWEDHS